MTALRRRELELAQRAHSRTLEEPLQVLMDRAPVPIYIKDRDYRYVIANRIAHAVVGLNPNELIGRCDEDFMPPESARALRLSDARVIEGGESLETEETIAINGQNRIFLSVKFPYVDDLGQTVGLSGVSTDITDGREARRLAEELAAAQTRAIQELRSSRQETVERLARAIEQHDAETGAHVTRMARIAAYLGELLGLDEEQVLLLRA